MLLKNRRKFCQEWLQKFEPECACHLNDADHKDRLVSTDEHYDVLQHQVRVNHERIGLTDWKIHILAPKSKLGQFD